MIRLSATLAATSLLAFIAPAHAQSMQGMDMPGMTMPMPAKKHAHRPAMIGKKLAKKAGAKRKHTVARAAVVGGMHGMDHASMAGMDPSAMPGMRMPAAEKPAASQSMPAMGHSDMSGMDMSGSQKTGARQPTPAPNQSAMPGMTMPADSQTGSAGSQQDMQSMPGMTMPDSRGDMAGMSTQDVSSAGLTLPAGNAPAPEAPRDHAADRAYPPEDMAMAREHLQHHHGGQNFSRVLLNLAEGQFGNGRDGYRWDGQAWFGGDVNRLLIKSEGEGTGRNGVGSAEVQALYSRAIGPYFNLQAGARQDLGPSPKRTYVTVGFEGLAPGMFEVEGALFLSNKGDLLGRLEGYYDQRITQRLVLQPRAELNFAAQNVPENRIGSGLSNAELGLRLRYELRREFAPYIGVSWDRRLGDTARFAEAAGEKATSATVVAGVRVWF